LFIFAGIYLKKCIKGSGMMAGSGGAHNANLVVNTDADQVIVATSERKDDGGLPTITYTAGSIENPKIRKSICLLLEGGRRAFLEREKRYRIDSGSIADSLADMD
jgi:hypothetical protein